jgi:hypothetical protein
MIMQSAGELREEFRPTVRCDAFSFLREKTLKVKFAATQHRSTAPT